MPDKKIQNDSTNSFSGMCDNKWVNILLTIVHIFHKFHWNHTKFYGNIDFRLLHSVPNFMEIEEQQGCF